MWLNTATDGNDQNRLHGQFCYAVHRCNSKNANSCLCSSNNSSPQAVQNSIVKAWWRWLSSRRSIRWDGYDSQCPYHWNTSPNMPPLHHLVASINMATSKITFFLIVEPSNLPSPRGLTIYLAFTPRFLAISLHRWWVWSNWKSPTTMLNHSYRCCFLGQMTWQRYNFVLPYCWCFVVVLTVDRLSSERIVIVT